VLFVSHNMSAVTALARRSILVARGRVVFDGDTDAAIERYLGEGTSADQHFIAPARAHAATITGVDVRTSQGGRVQAHGTALEVSVEITTPVPVTGARVYITLVNRLGRLCAQAWRFDSASPMCRTAGVHRFECRFPHLRLAPGQYLVRVALADRHAGTQDEVDGACPFEVVMYGEIREGGWPVNQVAYFDDVEWN
jgi:lipopolysaccharide transport system ATP-binding protein